ncbi:hypothetical protein ACFVXE_12940 [Streptomyces sp. NPDC058231]|uniref:hypothetical protein n=1 Tax=Streptomyces sp. NPDC058231 TaxID=3346392 RepID=UPI0036E8A655
MTATTLRGPASRRPGRSLPLARILIRQFRAAIALWALSVLGVCLQLTLHYQGWADAVALRNRVGSEAYHFRNYVGDAHVMTARLLADGNIIAFRPALIAAVITGLLTAREWEARRVTLTLSQSVSPRRWFGVRWATMAGILVVLTLPLVVLYQVSAAHAVRLDLLVHGWSVQAAYFSIGPVTLAYVLLGVAAGALTGTRLRRTLPTVIAAPVLTWLSAALLVRSRAVLLLDFPLFPKVDGFHPGGLLGLQFYDALPQDVYLVNSLGTGDYWGYQIASSVLVLALAAVFALAAFRVLRRRTA